VEVKAAQGTTLPIVLPESQLQLQEVVIQSTVRAESEISAILTMQNNYQISDVYSGDMILRTSSDLYVSTAISRLPGVSLLEDRFLVIRGLYERYNMFTLNGGLLPVTGIERQAFEFSTLPAAIISQLQLVKGGSPDRIAGFAGGLIEIETPDIPEQNQLVLNYQMIYNDRTTFRPFLQYGEGNKRLGLFQDVEPMLPNSFPSAADVQGMDPASEELAAVGRQVRTQPVPTQFNALPGQNISARYQGRKALKNSILGYTLAANLIDIYSYEDIDMRIVRLYDENKGLNPVTDFANVQSYRRQQGLNAFGNLALKYNRGTLAWYNMWNQTQWNNAVQNDGEYIVDPDTREFAKYDFWPMRFQRQNMYSTQLKGEHVLSDKRNGQLKLDYLGFYTYTSFDEPGYFATNFLRDEDDGKLYYDLTLEDEYETFGYMFQGRQVDQMYGGGADITVPLRNDNIVTDFKTGILAIAHDRSFDSRYFGFFPSDNFNIPIEELEQGNTANYYAPQNIRPDGFVLKDVTTDFHRYNARSLNLATYGMFNIRVKGAHLVIGARLERFDQTINTLLIEDDAELTLANPVMTDVLPSFNWKQLLTKTQNLKVAVYQSVARPDARELSRLDFFNLTTSFRWMGNPNLQRSKITNADLRWEWFPGGLDMFSATLFTKHFDNPIEQYIDVGSVEVIQLYSLTNRDQAWVGGLEVEMRKRLTMLPGILQYSGLYFNASLMRSRVDTDFGGLFESSGRQLQGQSNYLVNGGVFFNEPKTGLSLDIFYSRAGARISVVGTGDRDFPDLWELPRDRIDAQLTKRVGTRWEFKLAIQDLLNQPIQRVQIYDGRTKFDPNRDQVLINNQRGRTSLLSITYKL
jgi:hypothetical protein